MASTTTEIFQRRKANCIVSVVLQISRLQLDENEKLSEYFIKTQELMCRLTETGEKISETLFNALIVNGLPEKYEHFVVQESFNPAANFTELRTRSLKLIMMMVESKETK